MAYEKLNLKTADKITASDLAHIEQGITDVEGSQVAPQAGTAAALTAGTETTAKVWSAKVIADYVKAEVAKVSAV